MRAYVGRPGVSPVVATLVAAGLVGPRDRALDVGCGTGTDALALAAWGVRRVVGLDVDAVALATARSRARALGLADRVAFVEGSVTRRVPGLDDGAFTIALDTLCWNNLHALNPRSAGAYARQLHRVLAPGGRLVLAVRARANPWTAEAPTRAWPPSLVRRFALGPTVTTQLAEWPASPRARPHATVSVAVGRRRSRERPAGASRNSVVQKG